jgi:predicted nucleic acid-binding protein
LRAVDTAFLIDLLRGEPGAVEKAEEIDEAGGAATTSISLFEIAYGVYRSRNLDQDRRLSEVERLFTRMDVFPFEAKAAAEAGKILGTLAREGRIIDVLDGMIGATVLVHGCDTLVTRNVDHFNRIPGLNVEAY